MKFCIIGVGRMGLRHVAVARSLGFEIAGIYDLSDEMAEKARAEFDLPSSAVFRSVDAMLRDLKPETLTIASTAPSHCDFVCRAAEAGVRYILCEKPMAVSIDECDRMIEACRASGAVLGINHQMRYMEQYTAVRALVDSPELGGLSSMTVAGSNFGFAMNASHYFEAFRYLTDEPIVSVSSWLDPEILPNPRGPQYEDRSGQLRGVSSSGKRLYMELSAEQGHGLHVVYGCRYGQIFSDQLTGMLRVVHREPQDRELPTSRYGMPSIEKVMAIAPADVINSTQALWRSMLAGASFPDGANGRYTVAGVVAVNASGEQGGAPVRLDAAPRSRSFAWA